MLVSFTVACARTCFVPLSQLSKQNKNMMSVLYFQVFLIISGKNLIDIHRQKSTLQEMATVRNLFGSRTLLRVPGHDLLHKKYL